MVALDLVDVHDAGRPRADLRHLRFPRRSLTRPGMVAAPASTHEPPSQDTPRAEVRSLGLAARPEREHVEPLVARAQGVELAHAMDDAVAGPTSNAESRSRQMPEPPRTKKISSSAVCRCKGVDHFPGSILIRLKPDRLRSGRRAEVGPFSRDVAGFARSLSPRPSGRSHADYVPCQRRA